jgi:hypothetical protein
MSQAVTRQAGTLLAGRLIPDWVDQVLKEKGVEIVEGL